MSSAATEEFQIDLAADVQIAASALLRESFESLR